MELIHEHKAWEYELESHLAQISLRVWEFVLGFEIESVVEKILVRHMSQINKSKLVTKYVVYGVQDFSFVTELPFNNQFNLCKFNSDEVPPQILYWRTSSSPEFFTVDDSIIFSNLFNLWRWKRNILWIKEKSWIYDKGVAWLVACEVPSHVNSQIKNNIPLENVEFCRARVLGIAQTHRLL